MQTLRISPSLMEEWRLVVEGAFNKTQQDLRDKILKDFVPTAHVLRGRAYHLILENGAEEYAVLDTTDIDQGYGHTPNVDYYEVLEPESGTRWRFSYEAIKPALFVRRRYPSMVFEQWGRVALQVEGFEIDCRMRLDGLQGYILNEFKTTSGRPKYEYFADSLQWRMYMLAHPEILYCNYHVFQLEKMYNFTPERPQLFTRCNYHEFIYHRYSDLENDVRSWLTGLVRWLQREPECFEALLIQESQTA